MDYSATKLVPNIDVGFAASLLSDVFGINSPIYLPYILGKEFSPKGYELPDNYAGWPADQLFQDEYDRMSVFDTPVFGSFAIAGGTYRVYDKKSGELVDRSYEEFEFPLATLIEFKRSKSIVKTPTTGGLGSVKEIYGFEDWDISIKGLCINDPSRSCRNYGTIKAIDQKLAIIQLNEIAGSLEIDTMFYGGRIFLEKGIRRLVIEDLSIGSIQGKPNIIPFEIKASSDEDLLLFV